MNGVDAHLWLYFLVVLGIVALPGLDMAFVMGSSLLGGRRAGMAAVGGIVAGGACHVLMGALGVAAVLAWWPPLFDLMLGAGSLYLGWMGWSLMRSSAAAPADAVAAPAARPAVSAGATFVRAMATNLLNPKAYVFMLAIFPRFLKPALGPVWLQASLLGAITALTQFGIYGALALLTARAGTWLAHHRGAAGALARLLGALLIGVALLGLWRLGAAHD